MASKRKKNPAQLAALKGWKTRRANIAEAQRKRDEANARRRAAYAARNAPKPKAKVAAKPAPKGKPKQTPAQRGWATRRAKQAERQLAEEQALAEQERNARNARRRKRAKKTKERKRLERYSAIGSRPSPAPSAKEEEEAAQADKAAKQADSLERKLAAVQKELAATKNVLKMMEDFERFVPDYEAGRVKLDGTRAKYSSELRTLPLEEQRMIWEDMNARQGTFLEFRRFAELLAQRYERPVSEIWSFWYSP